MPAGAIAASEPVPPWPNDGEFVSLVRPPRQPQPLALAADPAPAIVDRSRSVLVVVDMQNDFLDERGWFGRRNMDLRPVQAVIPAVQAAVEAAKAHGMKVIRLNWGVRSDCLEMSPGQLAMGRRFHTTDGYGDQPEGAAEPNLVAGTWGAATVDALAPAADEPTVHKCRFSGFWHNELDAVLRRLDAATLFFVGINTDRCVLASLQDATFLGYDAIMIEDATATPSAPEVRASACTLIRQIYGFTTTLDAFHQARPVANGDDQRGG